MDDTVGVISANEQWAAEPTICGSVYVKPQVMAWEPTQFDGIAIKVLYEDGSRRRIRLATGRIAPRNTLR